MNSRTIIELIISPNKQSTKIVEIMNDGIIRMHIKSPPVEGKANAEMIRCLAKMLGISQNQIQIIKGIGKRRKMLSINGIDNKKARFLLQQYLFTHHK